MPAPVNGVSDTRAVLSAFGRRLEPVLEELLPPSGAAPRLQEAMRYAALGGGKFIRPYLVEASASMFGVPACHRLRAGAATEMVHAYSLVHDDLPAMDDDDLRRGRATCHRAFDEGTAILAGDALLTRAFEVLAEPPTHPDPAVRSDLVMHLGRSVGSDGMAGGQMVDLESEHTPMDSDQIIAIMRLKTGALLGFCTLAGAILGQGNCQDREHLLAFGRDLGLAFQMVDDLLDVEGDEASMGKRVAKDADAGKATLVSLLGVDDARSRAREMGHLALSHLDPFGSRADALRAAAEFVLRRDH